MAGTRCARTAVQGGIRSARCAARLAAEAATLADMICWAMLEQGDTAAFARHAAAGALLYEFAVSANLLP